MSEFNRKDTLREKNGVSKQKKNKGCFDIIFSVLSKTNNHKATKVEEVYLKSAYKQKVEKMQDYLTYCMHMDMAKENGLNPNSSNDHHTKHPNCSPSDFSNSHFDAIKVHARINGWCIQPNEVEFHDKIGEGTTAAIYRGTWRGLDVAVKCIKPSYFQETECSTSWFAQELDTLSRQRHPFVLQLLGACLQPPENAWIVTELLSKKTMTEYLYGHKKRHMKRSIQIPPLKERLEKGLEIAQGMQYLHEQKPKVIHRDLKPSNILLDDSMHVRIADFGHARFLPDGEQALTGEMGTFVYMAPEVIRNEPYNEKCDVYSFGVILNELITGERPYYETNCGPSQIAIGVADRRLRPKLPQENNQSKELIKLICSAWNEDCLSRPTFAVITCTLKQILEMQFNGCAAMEAN